MTLELTHVGLFVKLADHYTIRGTQFVGLYIFMYFLYPLSCSVTRVKISLSLSLSLSLYIYIYIYIYTHIYPLLSPKNVLTISPAEE